MGECGIFSIIGGYEKVGLLESGYRPSKDKYDEAIAYSKPKRIRLGCMGSGFKVLNPSNPCVVTSKSLELVDHEYGKAVYS